MSLIHKQHQIQSYYTLHAAPKQLVHAHGFGFLIERA